MSNRFARGATLVELIVAIVIIGVALAGLVAVFMTTSRASVDPMIARQSLAVAESMMEEVLLQPYGPPAAQSPAGPARDTLGTVGSFNGYTSDGVYNAHGDPVPGLAGYKVAVAVTTVSLPNISNGALKVSVTVTHDSTAYVLNGWRTQP